MDPIDLRLKNAASKGTKTSYGPTFGAIGFVETLEAAKKSDALQEQPLPGQGARRGRRLLVQRRRRVQRGARTSARTAPSP